jgi:hypothetical protein
MKKIKHKAKAKSIQVKKERKKRTKAEQSKRSQDYTNRLMFERDKQRQEMQNFMELMSQWRGSSNFESVEDTIDDQNDLSES